MVLIIQRISDKFAIKPLLHRVSEFRTLTILSQEILRSLHYEVIFLVVDVIKSVFLSINIISSCKRIILHCVILLVNSQFVTSPNYTEKEGL